MRLLKLQKIERWVEENLSYPGISKDELALKKAYWMASLVCAVIIIVLTVTFKVINPSLEILFFYGIIMGFLFLEWVIELLIFHYNIERRMFINQVLITLITFVVILLLGGIPSSGGLIFVGFFVVLFSLDFKKRAYSKRLFVVYILTLVLAGVFHPYLTTAPEMTRGVNVSLYVINLLWISSLSFLFVLNFIRERVKVEQREAERLKEMDLVKTRLYSNITHEFRTPLTIILGMAGLIRENPGEWTEEGSRKIERHGRILLHQVNQMLELAKLESGSMSLHMVQGDIISLTRQVLELFRSTANEKSIKLSFFATSESLLMDFDPEKLLQILSNLISNALKYTGKGGMVELKVIPDKRETAVEISIKDNGPGIPEDSLPHIFERFYRVEKGDEQAIEGTGLGLAFTRELVSLLGGKIGADSVEGSGTTFCISLPLERKAPLQTEKDLVFMEDGSSHLLAQHLVQDSREDHIADFHEDERNAKARLLIVEDHQDVVDYLLTIVDPYYEVYTAGDGKAGFVAALEYAPDIILSDLMMPVMDGLQLLERLKSDMRTSHIPVVLLTARADIESRLMGLERGAEAYLPKPFNRDELLIRLRKIIDQRNLLHKRYSGKEWINQQPKKEYAMEDKFIGEIRALIDQNLDNDEFDILGLSRAMSMSRSQLYRKFKTLTNKTIGEYLRAFRLNRAREMLEDGQVNVSEAAYQTGFRNLSHFSRVFNSEFGYKPSDILCAFKVADRDSR